VHIKLVRTCFRLWVCHRSVAWPQVTCLMMSRHHLYCAGVGANMTYVMGQDMWMDPVTQLHVPQNEVERQRVEEAGAEIQKEALQVENMVTVSRCTSYPSFVVASLVEALPPSTATLACAGDPVMLETRAVAA
jgi:hypothetical protein